MASGGLNPSIFCCCLKGLTSPEFYLLGYRENSPCLRIFLFSLVSPWLNVFPTEAVSPAKTPRIWWIPPLRFRRMNNNNEEPCVTGHCEVLQPPHTNPCGLDCELSVDAHCAVWAEEFREGAQPPHLFCPQPRASYCEVTSTYLAGVQGGGEAVHTAIPILAAERNGEEPTCVRYGARLFRTLSSNPPKAPGGNHLIPSLHVWKLLSRMTNRWEQGYSQKWSHRDRNTDWFVCFHSLRFFNFIFPHHHPHPPASPRKCRAIQNKALKTQDCVQPVLAPWTSCK